MVLMVHFEKNIIDIEYHFQLVYNTYLESSVMQN
ncbi:hypothetical protein ACUXCC_001416 [Cytobacillus horneckiae]